MLRPDGDHGKIRDGDRVFIPDHPIDAASPFNCTRSSAWRDFSDSGDHLRGREKQSDFKNLRSRRKTCAAAVSHAFSCETQVHVTPSTKHSAGACRRGRSDGRRLGQEKEKAGANRVITLCYLAATGTTRRTPVRVARIGTTLQRIRTTTSVAGASVTHQFLTRCRSATAICADRLVCGQPVLSSLGKHFTGFARTPSREISKGAGDISMGKKHRNLIQKFTDAENMKLAYHKTSKAKRMTWGYLEFKEYDQVNLAAMANELTSGQYRIGEYRHFTVYEPKPRLISALDFKDRLVQHAVCNVVSPIFEKVLLPNTFACRVNLGTHAGVRYIQSKLRTGKYSHFLKTDFSKFFPSIDREILHKMITKKVRCEKTLLILREIIPESGKGIPIGSLTSQLFANVYGNSIDRFIHFGLGHRTWARYMDDILILGSDPESLMKDYARIVEHSDKEMAMKISRWQVSPVSKGVNFLGYRIWPNHKLLRKDSVTRAKRKVKKFCEFGEMESLQKFIASWSGHARWADTHNLLKHLEQTYAITF